MGQTDLIPAARIERRILLLRGQKVILDYDLAALYEVETKVLNQAVRRNIERFPGDFMFKLSWNEARMLSRSQIVTLTDEKPTKSRKTNASLRSQTVTLKRGEHRKFRPYAFTEQGVAMLSSVLRSPRAVQVNIAIMRTFVQLREMLASHADLAHKLDALERRYDAKFRIVFVALREMMADHRKPKGEIGFHTLLPGHKSRRSKIA